MCPYVTVCKVPQFITRNMIGGHDSRTTTVNIMQQSQPPSGETKKRERNLKQAQKKQLRARGEVMIQLYMSTACSKTQSLDNV